jgi:hypothetical protein
VYQLDLGYQVHLENLENPLVLVLQCFHSYHKDQLDQLDLEHHMDQLDQLHHSHPYHLADHYYLVDQLVLEYMLAILVVMVMVIP